MNDSPDTPCRSRKSHVTPKQRLIMLTFMEEHRAFQRGELIGQQGRLKQFELRYEMASKLNACGDGVSKDPTKWIKSWQDWKNNVKNKAASIQRHQQGTGGGSPLKSLTSLEERCLELITLEAVTGDMDLPEGGARPAKKPAEENIFDVANLPIDVMDAEGQLVNEMYETEVSIPINEPQSQEIIQGGSHKRSRPDDGDKQTRKKSKVGGQTCTPASTELLQNYVSGEDKRLSQQQEMFEFKKEIKKEELDIKREELILHRRNSAAIILAANKLAILATEMASYYAKKNEELD